MSTIILTVAMSVAAGVAIGYRAAHALAYHHGYSRGWWDKARHEATETRVGRRVASELRSAMGRTGTR